MLSTVEVRPTGPASGSVIWLHGLGASGDDFEPVVPHLGLPDIAFVFPEAPQRPVTVNGGYVMPSWYDILSLSWDGTRESADDVLESAAAIREIIARENERGIPTNRIVLAGFSQGAALALYTSLRLPESLAGILILSGYLLQGETLAAEAHPANAATPMLHNHGRYDEVVPLFAGRMAYDRVNHGRDARWAEYPMGHEVSLPQIRDIGVWLRERLPATPR